MLTEHVAKRWIVSRGYRVYGNWLLENLQEGELASDFKCPDRGKGKGNFEVPFSRFPELFRARSRLYRSQFLQVNTRWKALVEIYKMHSFAPFSWDPSG